MNPKAMTTMVACVLLVALLCVMPNSSWADKKNNTVIIGMTQETTQYNPLLYNNPGTDNVPESCMFDALWDVDVDGKFIPNLATKIPTKENGGVSADGMTWKIELKKGVKWQDGAPFTAADVEFTFKCIMNPKINFPRGRAGFEQIKEFKVIDDHHIEYTMKSPFAGMYWIWQINHIIPKHVLSKVKDFNNCEWNTKNTFGTGPYKLVERVPGSHMVYKRNPDYHRGMPKVETIIHKFVTDQTVIYTQLKTGEIDVLGIQGIEPARYEEAKKIKGVDTFVWDSTYTEYLLFNCNRPVFKDKVVRQAMIMAVDWEKILKVVHYGINERHLSYLTPQHWAYNKGLKDPGFNPKKAAEMLEAAGWKLGSDGIREKNGVKLSFDKFSTTTGSKAREQAQLIAQQNWKKIGIDAKIKNLVPAVMWGDYFYKGQFDLCFVADPLMLGTDPDQSGLYEKFGKIIGIYQANKEMKTLWAEGGKTLDREKRKAIYGKIQEKWADETAIAPLFGFSLVYAKKKGLGGLDPKTCHYNQDITAFIHEWYWK